MVVIPVFLAVKRPLEFTDAMPFLLANMNQAKKQNLNFSNSEIHLIADILIKDLPEADKAKVKKIMIMMGK